MEQKRQYLQPVFEAVPFGYDVLLTSGQSGNSADGDGLWGGKEEDFF